eukprot:gene44212-58978_t
MRTHLNDHKGGLADMRRNVDAWWPLVEAGTVEALVMNASGCGVMVKDYGHALAHDPAYAERAARISALTRDLSEWLPELAETLRPRVQIGSLRKLAFHPPCTLQHGQQLRGGVEAGLASLGFEVQVAQAESHLCCGSAGTYSVLQPQLAGQLRERKLGHLHALKADCVVSANIGCIQHLQSGSSRPVRHWVEALDDLLERAQGFAQLQRNALLRNPVFILSCWIGSIGDLPQERQTRRPLPPCSQPPEHMNMNRQLIAAAVLSTLAGVAAAQSNVTVYGRVDLSVAQQAAAPDNKEVRNGSGSRLGFRGTEDLGGGLKATFVLESGINAQSGTLGQGGRAFGRQSFVGLGNDWGTLRLGR